MSTTVIIILIVVVLVAVVLAAQRSGPRVTTIEHRHEASDDRKDGDDA